MNQAQWDARVAALPGLWQYFPMDDASGLPQDESGNDAHMTTIGGSQVLAYSQGGPFAGADGIACTVAGAVGVYSAVVNPPTNTVNYGHPKGMEAWVNLIAAPTLANFTVIAAGNIGIVMDTDRTLQIARWANPNTFSGNSVTALEIGEWYYVAAISSGGDDMELWIGTLDTPPAVEASGTFAWPIPNGSLLRAGALPAFDEVATVRAVYSNMALYSSEFTPEFPATPLVASMNAVIPAAG